MGNGYDGQGGLYEKPAWVGVAVRYRDGRLLTFEFDGDDSDVRIDRDLEAEREVHAWGLTDPIRSAVRRISLRITGRMMTARHFSEWDQPRHRQRADPAAGELGAAPRPLPAGRQALEPRPGGGAV